jgi:hypothetical protein
MMGFWGAVKAQQLAREAVEGMGAVVRRIGLLPFNSLSGIVVKMLPGN